MMMLRVILISLKGKPGQPEDLGRNFSMWMLLERLRFTIDGFECNKIGVGYEAFNGQPNLCSSPFWSCLHNQLWNYRDVSIANWTVVSAICFIPINRFYSQSLLFMQLS